uniref:Uncharacterized protein n=1 Tax=Octopus bimaculoides TaxID=37653 RepID=A0A0L8IB54_OCTBM
MQSYCTMFCLLHCACGILSHLGYYFRQWVIHRNWQQNPCYMMQRQQSKTNETDEHLACFTVRNQILCLLLKQVLVPLEYFKQKSLYGRVIYPTRSHVETVKNYLAFYFGVSCEILKICPRN